MEQQVDLVGYRGTSCRYRIDSPCSFAPRNLWDNRDRAVRLDIPVLFSSDYCCSISDMEGVHREESKNEQLTCISSRPTVEHRRDLSVYLSIAKHARRPACVWLAIG